MFQDVLKHLELLNFGNINVIKLKFYSKVEKGLISDFLYIL